MDNPEIWAKTLTWGKQWFGGTSKAPVMDLDYRLRLLEERIPGPRYEDLEKYPALKDAYLEYKLIEKLIINEKT